MPDCPICKIPAREYEKHPKGKHVTRVLCATCGKYELTGTADSTVQGKIDNQSDSGRARAVLSHAINQMQDGTYVTIGSDRIESILKNDYLPDPITQAENMLNWFGQTEYKEGHGRYRKPKHSDLRGLIGAMDDIGVGYILSSLVDKKLLESPEKGEYSMEIPQPKYRLSFSGYEAYDQLKKGLTQSKKAFMAMKYGDSKLDSIFEKHFKPAVEETGFVLLRLDDEPEAGILDVRLQVAIRTSKFVIADLSHQNNGVYWEAGFATALDKPVIYTCDRKKKDGIHFDAEHWQYVEWDIDNPQLAAEKLKNVIRATLPTEAKMEDEK